MKAINKTIIVALIVGGFILLGCSNPASFDPKPGTPLPTEFTVPDFSGVEDGTLLSELGYEVVSSDTPGGNPLDVPGFVVNGEVIESDSDDLAGWFDFATPEFEIDRNENGGVIVEWEVRYPESIPSGNSERAKFYLRLTDSEGTNLYRFLFKPYVGADQTNFNLELAKDSTDPETSLQQVRSRDIDPSYTPTGPSAPWINFKFKLEASGEITLLIDDVVFMSGVTDSNHSLFSKVKFTYRTTNDAKNYTIQIRNLSVLPLE
jgi:hypothetical protein